MDTTYLDNLIEQAKADCKTIVFPESTDLRILEAAVQIKSQKIATPILIGKETAVRQLAADHDLDLTGIEIKDPTTPPFHYTDTFYELRKNKGITPEQAQEIMQDPIYFGTMMVHLGEADGLVAGAINSTANTIRPALQIIKTAPDAAIASSFFLMIIRGTPYIFSDCGFVIDPDAEQLANITISAHKTAKSLGIDPRVAMLSFSTKGSAKSPSVTKVQEAFAIVKEKSPEMIVDGELQVDAAIVPSVAAHKAPDSPLQGQANVLIFPNLDAGNMGYKLVQRFADAPAIGPILQGLNKPVNDLSRGCNVQEVIYATVITAIQAQNL